MLHLINNSNFELINIRYYCVLLQILNKYCIFEKIFESRVMSGPNFYYLSHQSPYNYNNLESKVITQTPPREDDIPIICPMFLVCSWIKCHL
jgi:hypothetical protein